MNKVTENLLRKYWYKGYRFIFKSKDNEFFITKQLIGSDADSNHVLSKKLSIEAVYLPLRELEPLFTGKISSSIYISDEVNIIDWSAIKVDTPVVIKRRGTYIVMKRYFKEFNVVNQRVGVFKHGCTSWSNQEGFADFYDLDEVTLGEVNN